MFLAPGVTAWFFYKYSNSFHWSTGNKGVLIKPPLRLETFDKQAKWRILFWVQGFCGESCLKQIDILARIRLALGRHLYDVDQYLILNNQTPSLNEELKTFLKQRHFYVKTLSQKEIKKLAALPSDLRVFVVNPESYLILGYKNQGNPDDVYKDLKQLLK